jgi:hypothetical protein
MFGTLLGIGVRPMTDPPKKCGKSMAKIGVRPMTDPTPEEVRKINE